ncbi:neuromedin-U receptor 2-like [Acanthaster planci]|uniref:Neuromedin-U receptor 2-like n=1 Tax=Acanthaster planci TaxID=133434 RepID=A0A8B7ZV47_ACAPL|nr:neuromedin-U receptor 2-like [Acanthaster planci]
MDLAVSTKEGCTDNNTRHISSAEEADSYYLLFSNFEEMTIAIVQPVILAFGLIGNIGFLLTVARVPSMRTATNFYLSNLAVADMMFLLITIGSRIRAYVMYGLPNDMPLMGRVGCVLQMFWKYTFNFAGLILITFISFERHMAVCHPLRHRVKRSRSRSVKLTVACWIVAMLLALLVIPSKLNFKQYCFSWNTEDPRLHEKFPGIIGQCQGVEGLWPIQMFYVTQTVPFFFALFGNAYFYTRILLKLHQRDRHVRQRTIRTRNQVAVMLVANGTVFFLTTNSFEVTSVILFVQSFLTEYLIKPEHSNTLFEINRILVYTNSAVNPLVYTLTNTSYRRAFRRAFALGYWRNRRQKHSPTVTTLMTHDMYQINRHFPSGNQTPAPAVNMPLSGDTI